MTTQRRGRLRLRAHAHHLTRRLLVICVIATAGFAAAWGTASGSAGPSGSGHAAADPPLTWSAPINVDGANRLAGVSCASATLCAAVDSFNVVSTTNPTGGGSAWSVTPINLDDASGVSCVLLDPSKLCVAVDCRPSAWWSADPTGGAGAWQTSFGTGGCGLGRVFTAVSCPTLSTCVAADNEGNVTATTAPTSPNSSAWHDANVDSSHAIQAISCPTAALCVAVDNAGNVISTTDPTGGAGSWQVANIDGSAALSSVACSPAPLTCTVGDGAGNMLTSSNPTAGAGAWATAHVDGTATVLGLSCPSSTLCVGVDNQGYAIMSASPTAGAAAWSRQRIDTHVLGAVSCPSMSLCVAADWNGNIIEGTGASAPPPTTTTTPTTPTPSTTTTTTAPPSPPRIPLIAIGDLGGQTTVDLSCPPGAGCGTVTLQFTRGTEDPGEHDCRSPGESQAGPAKACRDRQRQRHVGRRSDQEARDCAERDRQVVAGQVRAPVDADASHLRREAGQHPRGQAQQAPEAIPQEASLGAIAGTADWNPRRPAR